MNIIERINKVAASLGSVYEDVYLTEELIMIADTLAAGALVPVPVGEPCTLYEMEYLAIKNCTNTCTVDDANDRIYAAERRMDDSGQRYLMPITDKWPPGPFPLSTIVQPVRLVPIKEWEV